LGIFYFLKGRRFLIFPLGSGRHTLWQSFGLSVGLWGFANVCNVGWGFIVFLRVGEKNKINSLKFALSYQRAKI